MTQEFIDAVCKEAVSRYGDMSQVDMAVEEMAELTDALMKDRRGRVTANDVISEIADVTIMVRQLALMFGLDKVNEAIDLKINRLQDRMHTNCPIK